jgi:hypothetical protein
MFAAQSRLLLRMGRPTTVAERGLHFVRRMLATLVEKQGKGLVRPLFKEVRPGGLDTSIAVYQLNATLWIHWKSSHNAIYMLD